MRIRRDDDAPRLEMLPLIDVTFLLLTFFIHAMLTMVRLEAVPVELAGQAKGVGEGPAAEVVSIDAAGGYRWNNDRLSEAAFEARLAAFMDLADRPMLYVTLDAQGEVDRGPALLQLMQRLTEAGVKQVTVVGRPPTTPVEPPPPVEEAEPPAPTP